MAEPARAYEEMPKAYEPGVVEKKWYDFWIKKGYFTPVIDKSRKPFVIIMPPPNLTGDLHMGHAMPATLEDIMARWHRMMGEPTLWLPGVDHAAIAAQVVVERQLVKQGTSREKLGREQFLERMYQWVDKCRNTITEQHKRLGISCDWSRERYTMEPAMNKPVRTTFKRLYDKGLIYRGERISNWCPRCATALSDLEVDHKDLAGHLWYVRYPIVGEEGSYITVATTRPETILGDTAVAVNPNDERFKNLVGKKALLPFVNREIPIIADEAVSTEFGTGAVKITPGHDPVDFEVGQRNNLPIINILNRNVTMNENAGPYQGMDRFECRKAIVADLEKTGQLVKIEDYGHAVGHCQRCSTLVEPIVSMQWYIKIEPLAKPAIEVVNNGSITIIPERFTKVYLNWMENIKDWCISRQLWWGHRIPVWYCRDCGEIMVEIDDPTVCMKCGSKNIEQDPDTLDTWFSSGLWPHSTLGWPDETDDFEYFYPTTVMETAYDILFFWVARMIMMGIENTGKIPFSTVYLHGLIRDEKGEKMSKTKGNGIDPLVVMDEYGTDALRFAITTGIAPGGDSRLSNEKMESGRNFANKLWNATRFVIRSIEGDNPNLEIDIKNLTVEDRWILSRLNRTIGTVQGLMRDFQFGEAEHQVHDFLWNEYCDWYIELSKTRLNTGDGQAVSPIPVLVHVIESSLRLLHPCMPFVTEELWQQLKQRLPEGWQEKESIMISAYPEADERYYDAESERIIETVIEIVRSVRNARAQYNVENSKWIEAQVFGGELTEALERYTKAIETLAKARPVIITGSKEEMPSGDKVLAIVLKETEVVIPMESMVDIEAEKKRLQKEIDDSQAQADRLEVRLKDRNFVEKAPAVVVDKERQKREALLDKISRLKQQLQNYSEVE